MDEVLLGEELEGSKLRSKQFLKVQIASFLLLIAAGCSRGDGLTLVSVKGTVTVGDSDPFAGGIVRFTPSGKGSRSAGAAVTDDDGTYVIQHQSGRTGIEPGDYQVSFSLYKMPDGSPVPDQSGEADPKTPSELGALEYVPNDYSRIFSEVNRVTVGKNGGEFDFKIPSLEKPKKR